MASKKLYSYSQGYVYPQIEDGIYLTSENINSTTLESNNLYVVDDYINPDVLTEYTIPENSILQFTVNGSFGPNVELWLNNTPIEAHLTLIFDVSTKVHGFIRNAEVPVEWFGAKGDGFTDDAPAINQCIKYSADKTVLLGASFYRVKDTIKFVEDNYDPSTFEDVSTCYWMMEKSFVCNGCIIGDPSLDNKPAVELYMGCGTFHIKYIRHLSTNDRGCALLVKSPAKDFYVGKIMKVDFGQGFLCNLNPDEEPTSTTGAGVCLGGYLQGGTLRFGSIIGFHYGIAVTENINTTAHISLVNVEVSSMYKVGYPFFVNLTSNANFVNCNNFSLCQFGAGGAGSGDGKYLTQTSNSMVYLACSSGLHIASNIVTLNSFEGNYALKMATLTGCYRCYLRGYAGYGDMQYRDSNGTIIQKGTLVLYAINKNTSYYSETSNMITLKRCFDITFDFNNPIPYELFAITDCADIRITKPSVGLSNLGNAFMQDIYFADMIYMPVSGSHYTSNDDSILMVNIITPHVSDYDKLIFVETMPDTPDTTKWYVLPVSDMGIAKYELKIYLLDAWKTSTTKSWKTVGYLANNVSNTLIMS